MQNYISRGKSNVLSVLSDNITKADSLHVYNQNKIEILPKISSFL